MTFSEHVLKDYIRLHPDYDSPVFGTDQAFVSYPVRFSTGTFQLDNNDCLCNVAEEIRKESGYPSLYDSDDNGWYDFWSGINSFSESKVDSCIEFMICGSSFADDEEIYRIDLSEDEQRIIFDSLDRQCKQIFGKGCDELLEESSKRMED